MIKYRCRRLFGQSADSYTREVRSSSPATAAIAVIHSCLGNNGILMALTKRVWYATWRRAAVYIADEVNRRRHHREAKFSDPFCGIFGGMISRKPHHHVISQHEYSASLRIYNMPAILNSRCLADSNERRENAVMVFARAKATVVVASARGAECYVQFHIITCRKISCTHAACFVYIKTGVGLYRHQSSRRNHAGTNEIIPRRQCTRHKRSGEKQCAAKSIIRKSWHNWQ